MAKAEALTMKSFTESLNSPAASELSCLRRLERERGWGGGCRGSARGLNERQGSSTPDDVIHVDIH